MKIFTIASLFAFFAYLPVFSSVEFFQAPELAGKTIIYCVHAQYPTDHHNTESFFQKGEYREKVWPRFAGNSSLELASFDSEGKIFERRVLYSLPEGVIRDVRPSFDGKKAVFSARRNQDDDFHIYEADLESGEVKQLTKMRGVSDLDPAYLPNGKIVFSSTRAMKYCGCNRNIMGNLYSMNSDGTNIVQIGNSIEFENGPSVMNDGRILYTRWEYVDRNFSGAQGLWTCTPDGARHWIFWGQSTRSAALNASQMKSGKVAAILAACHDKPWGALALIDRNIGLEGEESVVKIFPESARSRIDFKNMPFADGMKDIEVKYQYPSPFGENSVLVSKQIKGSKKNEEMGLFLVDFDSGKETPIARAKGFAGKKSIPLGIFNGNLLEKKTPPPAMPPQFEYGNDTAFVYVSDVYEGTHMKGVKKGEIKFLRVVDDPPKRNWSLGAWENEGQQPPAMNFDDYDNKVDLGLVPVEEDGSAYFKIPARKFLYLQACDKDGRMIQSMRSGFSAVNGEIVSCSGCHESRNSTPPAAMQKKSIALTKPPSEISPGPLSGRPFSFARDIQPIFDKHCLECHDFDGEGEDSILLCGDKGLVFNKSYLDIFYKNVISAIGAGGDDVVQANSWGARKSLLISMVEEGHGDTDISRGDVEALALWIDLNAPYYPTDDCSYPDNPSGRTPLTVSELKRLFELCSKKSPLASYSEMVINAKMYPREIVSFDRPERSEILKGAKTEPEREEALKIIQKGAERLKRNPRADMKDFKPTKIALERISKAKKLEEFERRAREAESRGERIPDAVD